MCHLVVVFVHLEVTPPKDLSPLAIITFQIPDDSIFKVKYELGESHLSES